MSLRNNLFLLGILAVIASIMKPPVSIFYAQIPLWSPLEVIANNNRWICVGICFFIITLSLGKTGLKLPGFASLIALQILIFLKNYNAIFVYSIFLFFGFILMLVTTTTVASLALKKAQETNDIWFPVISASLIFIGINILQFYIDPSATVVVAGRFHGVTSNPLMFSLSSAIIAPTLLYKYHHTVFKRKWIYLITFIALLYFIYLSGSRLGALVLFLSISLFYRSKFAAAINFALPLLCLLIAWVLFTENVPISPTARIFSFETNRFDVWNAQLNLILEYPLWGIELEHGKRMGYGENSYLASGVSVGFSGLILILFFTFSIFGNLKRLLICERLVGWNPEISLAIAILGTCLVAALFEAFLLGIFTLPLIMLIYTLSISDGMIDRISPRKL